MTKHCEQDEIVNALLEKLDEHFAHKEHVSSQILIELTTEIKGLKAQYKEVAELLIAWNNAKGFLKVTKWLSVALISIGATIAALKALPITWK